MPLSTPVSISVLDTGTTRKALSDFMIRSVLTLRVKSGRSADLESFYAQHRVLERSRNFPGCLSSELLRAVDSVAATHLVIAGWATADDYRNWVADPWRAAVSEQLVTLLDADPGEALVGGVFETIPEA